jgi:transcriptional regulator with XRE-family HTH domain
MASVGATIRALRTRKDLSLPTLAELAGISKGLLFTIETVESSNPSVATLYKIAEALHVSIADLLHTTRAEVKRLPADVNAEWRKRVTAAIKAQGKAVDPIIVDSMQLLRNRKAAKRDDMEHWRFLYASIENSFKE